MMMKNYLYGIFSIALLMMSNVAYSQYEPATGFRSSDAYHQYMRLKNHKQRNVIDLDSILDYGNSQNGYVLNYRHLHSSDYTNGIFSRLTLWDIGSGWENQEIITYEADTSLFQVRYAYYDSYFPGYGWHPIPFAAGKHQYDTLFRIISDSVEMLPVNLRAYSEYFYDSYGRSCLTERKRMILYVPSQTWGPLHYFDSLVYQYHGNTDSLELITRYYLVQQCTNVQSWYKYQNKLVAEIEDLTDLTGSFSENSLAQYFYDQDQDMILRLYRMWDTATQAYEPYDSIVYRYYSPPLAHLFFVDWLVKDNYPDFGVTTKLLQESERFIYSPVTGYRPSMKYVYYYNVPGLSAPKEKTQEVVSGIYPNPASDHLYVFHNLPGVQCILNIFSTEGRLIKQTTVDEGNTKVSIGHLSPGIYLYHITNKDTTISSGRLIILR